MYLVDRIHILSTKNGIKKAAFGSDTQMLPSFAAVRSFILEYEKQKSK